jgi:histidinol-phosphate aminotransferase
MHDRRGRDNRVVGEGADAALECGSHPRRMPVMTDASSSDQKSFPNAFMQKMPPWGMPPIQVDVKSPVPAGKLRRMNLNECPYPPSPKAVAAMQEACAHANWYPDPRWRDVTAAISERTGVPQYRVVMCNGSDEALVAAGRIALAPGDDVVAPIPSFGGYYKEAQINGATLTTVSVRQDGANDVDAMLAAITDRTRLVFMATPNNPTGQMLRTEEVERMALGVPDSALLVLDEAYYEFGIHAGGEEHLPALSKRTGPWAVFRTFSKAYGLAGIRCGYILAGSDAVADAFQTARSVFNLNAIAQAGAVAAYRDVDHMRMILENTARERERLVAGLKAFGSDPFPTVGNFVAAPMPRPAVEIIAAMAERGIMITRLQAPGYDNYIRITVGLPDDTDAVLAALREILAG